LIALQVGAAEKRGGELSVHLFHERGVDVRSLEPAAVLRKILPRCRHQARTLAKQRQRVGDVWRTPSSALVHRVDQEAQTDARHVLREDVLRKPPREGHQIIERN
jgi:hypothetical protein